LEQDLIETVDQMKKDQKILIVEDNSALREMLVSLFEPFYEVVTAVDGEDGLDKVKLEHPNIVLSDVMMPKMFGTELCKRIKEDIDTCHIPVVLLTARTTVDQNLEGLRIGADDCITKPFNNSVLVTRCNNLVNSRVVLQEKFSKQPQMTPRMLATNNLDKVCMDKIMSIVEKYIADTEFDVTVFVPLKTAGTQPLITTLWSATNVFGFCVM
jgi:DNA-binding response OmpR family regulator